MVDKLCNYIQVSICEPTTRSMSVVKHMREHNKMGIHMKSTLHLGACNASTMCLCVHVILIRPIYKYNVNFLLAKLTGLLIFLNGESAIRKCTMNGPGHDQHFIWGVFVVSTTIIVISTVLRFFINTFSAWPIIHYIPKCDNTTKGFV